MNGWIASPQIVRLSKLVMDRRSWSFKIGHIGISCMTIFKQDTSTWEMLKKKWLLKLKRNSANKKIRVYCFGTSCCKNPTSSNLNKGEFNKIF